MKIHTAHFLIALLFGLSTLVWGEPARAADDLIDVVEITGTDPIIVEDNILPGDSFTRTLTVKNLTVVGQDIALSLDIDTAQGLWFFPDALIEKQLSVRVQRVSDGVFLNLPGGGTTKTLFELSGTVIALGTLAPSSQEQYIFSVMFDINADNSYQRTKVVFDLSLGIDVIGEAPELRLRKFNDSITDEIPGNEVVYTLEVTAEGGPVDDVTVTDLPPEGFVYESGSGTGAPFLHEYASPGIWNVGTLQAGETRVLRYRAKISDTQDAGLYKDLAFAKGITGSGALFANSEANPFVGTAVNVVLPDDTVTVPQDTERKRVEKTKRKTQYVLGAATTLPLTGASAGVVGMALVGVVVGGGLVVVARRRASTLLPVILCALGITFMSAHGASAASLSVLLETPAPLTTTPNFQIGFVVLDVLSRPLTIECYREGDILPFATSALASSFGGNSGNCQVTESVFPVDGSVAFYVKALADGGAETMESEHATVTLHSTAPGTPTQYERTNDTCQQTISFITADDGGKTVKVELYRSESTTFVADASTKVAELAVGSHTSGSFVESAPGCSQDIFYVLRAVDAYGSGSDFVGDREVRVTTHTVTQTKTTTVTVPGANSARLVSADASQIGQVAGAETDTESNLSADKEGKAVLGEMTETAQQDPAASIAGTIREHWLWWMGGIALALFLGYKGYRIFRNRKQHDQTHEKRVGREWDGTIRRCYFWSVCFRAPLNL